MDTAALLRDIAAWTIPLVVCYYMWPLLRRRRAYVVTAAILCFTPMFVHFGWMSSYITIWPLVLSLPAYLNLLPGSLEGLGYMGLPGALVVGTIAWLISRRFVHPGDSDSIREIRTVTRTHRKLDRKHRFLDTAPSKCE
ncbi:MAG: hypothetical protein AAGE85_00505 [Pseudomonadota bacterium]